MPRVPRIEFAGAIYHIMSRGNRLDPIFEDDKDRKIFLETLEETCRSAGWSVHSYVLMGNHYHLLMETHRQTLVKGMQYLNSTYARRYNVRHKTFGHLLQGRYKALLVDSENGGYFLAVSDYIHFNPARAGMFKEMRELLSYPWSSLGWLVGVRRKRPEWLSWKRVYGELGMGDWKRKSRREYRRYLEGRILEVGKREERQQYAKIRRGWCLGAESFVEKMRDRLEELARKPRDRESWNDKAVEEMEEVRAMGWLKAGAEVLGYEKMEEVKGWDRYVLARWVRQRTKVSVKWLGEQLNVRTRGGMSSAIYLVGQRIRRDVKILRQWKRLEKIV